MYMTSTLFTLFVGRKTSLAQHIEMLWMLSSNWWRSKGTEKRSSNRKLRALWIHLVRQIIIKCRQISRLSVVVALGLDESDSNKSTLDVYRQYFEVPFLQATRKYYQEESRQFLAENSVVEYMKKVRSCNCLTIIIKLNAL